MVQVVVQFALYDWRAKDMNPNQYPVYPEKHSQNSDEKINSYSQV
jgi:hypothetical protein